MSHRVEHPMLEYRPLAEGRLKCVVPLGHPLAARVTVGVAEIVPYPLVGLDPKDPFGRIMARIFQAQSLDYEVTIKARFGSTVCALVTNGLGIAVVDAFTLAGGNWPGLRALDIDEPTAFPTFIACRRDATISSYAEAFVAALRLHMQQCVDVTALADKGNGAVAARARREKLTSG